MRWAHQLLAGGALFAACQAGETVEGSHQSPIAFGAEDAPSAILAVEREHGLAWDLCSGTLIAPDVVLTAAHCVTAQTGPIDCDSTSLEAPVAPELLRVSFVPNLAGPPDPSWTFFDVVGIELLADVGSPLCASDAALLFLADSVDPELARPLPVSSQAVNSGDVIRAAGYGAAHPSGTGERVRRISAPLEVLCRASDCADTPVEGYGGVPLTAPTTLTHEFITQPGACPGDSGGPALQGDSVVGVLSRGFVDCTAPVFGLPFAPLATKVRAHAEDIGAPVPDWAQPEEVPGSAGAPVVVTPPVLTGEAGAGGMGGAPEEPTPAARGGCQLTPHGSTPPKSMTLPILFSLLLLGARRRGAALQRKLAPLALLLLVGCTREVTDTEGRTFDIACKKDACRLDLQSETPTPEATPFEPMHAGRLLLACPSESADGRDCRPLVCEGDRVCSRLGGDKVECLDGLCQDPEKVLAAEDRLALCLAETGAWTGKPEQRSRMALAMSCRPPCQVPAECRQLTKD